MSSWIKMVLFLLKKNVVRIWKIIFLYSRLMADCDKGKYYIRNIVYWHFDLISLRWSLSLPSQRQTETSVYLLLLITCSTELCKLWFNNLRKEAANEFTLFVIENVKKFISVVGSFYKLNLIFIPHCIGQILILSLY